MTILFTDEEFNAAKSTDLLPLKCEQCGKTFYRQKKEIGYTLKNPSRNRCRFCSQECLSKNKGNCEPHHEKCTNCGKDIVVRNSDYNKSKTKHFFCSNSCAASYNNRLRGKRTDEERKKISETLRKRCVNNFTFVTKISDDEFKNIIATSKTWTSIGTKLGYANGLSSNVKESIRKRCKFLNIELQLNEKVDLLIKTKGEVFSYRKNWQSARSGIRKIAQKRYLDANPEHKCVICGYDKHIEVAHIKSVSEFDDCATIDEINALDNLIGLCPNHHWEYDNGLLKLK